MPNLNICHLIGHLTRDPETKFTVKGAAIVNFSLAINRQWKSETGDKMEEVTFVDIEGYGKQAEVVAQYCKKGQPLFVNGRLKMDSWENKESGQKRSRMKVVMEGFQFLAPVERRETAPDDSDKRPYEKPKPPADPDLDTPPSDIPF